MFSSSSSVNIYFKINIDLFLTLFEQGYNNETAPENIRRSKFIILVQLFKSTPYIKINLAQIAT